MVWSPTTPKNLHYLHQTSISHPLKFKSKGQILQKIMTIMQILENMQLSSKFQIKRMGTIRILAGCSILKYKVSHRGIYRRYLERRMMKILLIILKFLHKIEISHGEVNHLGLIGISLLMRNKITIKMMMKRIMKISMCLHQKLMNQRGSHQNLTSNNQATRFKIILEKRMMSLLKCFHQM